MQEQAETTGAQKEYPVMKEGKAAKVARRNAATKLWVFYEHEGQRGLVGFDFKLDLDNWLRETNAQILNIIRGVEKKFETKTRITI